MANSYAYAEASDNARIDTLKHTKDLYKKLAKKYDGGEDRIDTWLVLKELSVIIDKLKVNESEV